MPSDAATSTSAGRLKTSLIGPTCRTRPPMTTATASPNASASVRSCVTRTPGVPVACSKARSSRRRRARVGASSAAKGSSSSRRRGPGRQRARQRDPLRFPARQRPRVAIFEIRDPQHLAISSADRI